jgi:hypothetical protein
MPKLIFSSVTRTTHRIWRRSAFTGAVSTTTMRAAPSPRCFPRSEWDRLPWTGTSALRRGATACTPLSSIFGRIYKLIYIYFNKFIQIYFKFSNHRIYKFFHYICIYKPTHGEK